jgi:hypothetical protein
VVAPGAAGQVLPHDEALERGLWPLVGSNQGLHHHAHPALHRYPSLPSLTVSLGERVDSSCAAQLAHPAESGPTLTFLCVCARACNQRPADAVRDDAVVHAATL